jgi:hypothetical protein
MSGIVKEPLYSDEIKTCTIENYVWEVEFLPSDDDDASAAGVAQSLLQQSNNQALQPQTPSLRDTIADRTN